MTGEAESFLYHEAAGSSLATPLHLALWSTAGYLCLYGLRKPWAAAGFSDCPPILGAHPKVAIATAQTAGYFLGKLFGVRLVAQLPMRHVRSALLLGSGITFSCWVAFAILPYGVVSLVVVGLGAAPLALGWALTYRYVEGRRCSDAVAPVSPAARHSWPSPLRTRPLGPHCRLPPGPGQCDRARLGLRQEHRCDGPRLVARVPRS